MWALFAVVLATVAALCFCAQAAYSASEPNTEGYEFTDATGIVYKVTTPADAATGTAGSVELEDGSAYSQSELRVAGVADSGFAYNITALKYSAFEGNANLRSVVFTQSLEDVSEGKSGELTSKRRAIGGRAFAQCPNLESVSFEGARLNGIGDEAFYKCDKLKNVEFADGLEIFGTGYATGIGTRAFANTAITSIKIPAITCAKRTGDYYSDYDHDYESFPEDRDSSGYMGCWHDKLTYFGVETRGICEGAFINTPLEKVTFAAGNERGLFAYWNAGGAGLRYLPTLKSVVYEASQPYYGNPNGSLRNGSAADVWGLADDDDPATPVADPTFYYAVDFYASKDQADAADAAGTSRLARVEYARNTPTSAIQSADAAALEGYIYATPGDYATKAADGATPDPNAAARQAQTAGIEGFEDAAQHQWVWMLGNTQSRRAGLTDSCKAYLVHADSLEAGRIGTSADGEDQMGTMQLLCDQNLSKGSTQNSAFDHVRYFAQDSIYMFDEDSVKSYASIGNSHLIEGKTPWFKLNSRGVKGLLAQMEIYDAGGNAIDASDEDKFSVSFMTYDKEAGALNETPLADVSEGPVLLVITPKEGSGYDAGSSLQEWLLVKGSTATVKTLYAENAHDTWRKAVYINGSGRANPVSFAIDRGFAMAVSSGDNAGALAAVGYAGMCSGPISTVSSDSSYGFGIAWPGGFYSTGDIHGSITALARDKKESDASLAASNYQAFKKNRNRWGVDSAYAFGDTAVLVNPTHIADCAAAAASYSYAKAAPVFYTEKDGTLSAAAAECLADFKNVLVMGDALMVPDATLAAAQNALSAGGTATRLSGVGTGDAQERGNACSLSLAAAQLLTQGEGADNTSGDVSIIMAQGTDSVADVVGAMNFSGHGKGITLAVTCSADAKRIAQYLRSIRDDVTTVRLFGRNGRAAGSFDLKTALDKTWDEKAAAVAAVGAGDELELYGSVFTIGAGNVLTGGKNAGHLWGLTTVPGGTYLYGADAQGKSVAYTLASDHKVALIVVKEPKAASGLTYNAKNQVGVAAGSGLSVKNGSGKDAGAYTATVKPKTGYCWSDGSNGAIRIPWSIATASLKGAKLTLGSNRVQLAGAAASAKCGVTRVVLANGSKLNDEDYKVSYSNNKHAGTATVKVTGVGNATGSVVGHFTVVAAPAIVPGGTDSNGGDGGFGTSGAGSNGSDDGGEQTTASSDDGKAAVDAASSDGWAYFAPTSTPAENQDTTMLGSVSAPPAVNMAILIICCLAFAAAIFYSTHARRETDDTLREEVAGE